MSTKSVYLRRRIILILIFTSLVWGIVAGARKATTLYQNWQKYSKIRMVKGELRSGQVLFDALIEKDVSREAAAEIVHTIDSILDLRSLQVNDEFSLYLNENDRIEKFIYEKSPIEQYFVVRDEYGSLHAFRPSIFLNKETLTKEITIESSLFDAMLKADEKDSLVFDCVDIFAWDIDFYTYPRIGDTIRLYFEKYYKDKEFVKYGRVLAARYKGRETFDAVNFRGSYYGPGGKPTEKMFLKTPLKFTGRITSYFGLRRDPFTHRHGQHRGVDFASYYGAPIVATSDGTVTFSGWDGLYGRLVRVRHGNGYETFYGHCAKILVKRGQKVAQGQAIASVGSTGRSTGPHCHYEIRLQGNNLNPLQFNQPLQKALTGKDLEDFKALSKNIWKNIESI